LGCTLDLHAQPDAALLASLRGIDPDRDVSLMVIPPPQMVANLKAGNIDGYCAGEPWNSHAVYEGCCHRHRFRHLVRTRREVLGVREDWANQYPQTHLALVKALLEACGSTVMIAAIAKRFWNCFAKPGTGSAQSTPPWLYRSL